MVLRGLLVPGISRIVRRLLPPSRSPYFQALLANTANPTVLAAGEKENVVPGKASCIIDGRLLPGETLEGFLEQVKRAIGEGYSLEVLQHMPPTETSDDMSTGMTDGSRVDDHSGRSPGSPQAVALVAADAWAMALGEGTAAEPRASSGSSDDVQPTTMDAAISEAARVQRRIRCSRIQNTELLSV